MTIEEIQLEKEKVDDIITNAIIEFANKTGMAVDTVSSIRSETKCGKIMRYEIVATLPERKYYPSFKTTS